MLNPGEMNFPRFTAWLGTFSSSNKQKRIAGELTTKLQAAGVVCDRRDLRLQYLPTLRATLTDPLVREGADGIDTVLGLMQMYLISRCATDCTLPLKPSHVFLAFTWVCILPDTFFRSLPWR